MLEQKNVQGYGGTMRLGAYDCVLKKGSKAAKAYGKEKISERHRHRYEVNNEYKKLYSIKVFGTIFLIAGILCLLYFQYNETNFLNAPVV